MAGEKNTSGKPQELHPSVAAFSVMAALFIGGYTVIETWYAGSIRMPQHFPVFGSPGFEVPASLFLLGAMFAVLLVIIHPNKSA